MLSWQSEEPLSTKGDNFVLLESLFPFLFLLHIEPVAYFRNLKTVTRIASCPRSYNLIILNYKACKFRIGRKRDAV